MLFILFLQYLCNILAYCGLLYICGAGLLQYLLFWNSSFFGYVMYFSLHGGQRGKTLL